MSYDRPMRTLYKGILLILLGCALFAADPPVPTNPPLVNTTGFSALVSRDKLQIRDIQLAIAQAHITRLQAEAQIKSLESQLNQTIEDLKVQYSCQTCTLNADFTWTKPEPLKAPESAAAPAPQKDGPNPTKE
jgi:hypothetical protein